MRRWATALIILGALLIGVSLSLPAVVDAVPGRYLVRLQYHPVTARLLHWVRPIPTTLPQAPAPANPAPPPRAAALLPTVARATPSPRPTGVSHALPPPLRPAQPQHPSPRPSACRRCRWYGKISAIAARLI